MRPGGLRLLGNGRRMAWRWLARRVPEKYGDLVFDTEAFLKAFEEKYGARWAWILRKVINAAESKGK